MNHISPFTTELPEEYDFHKYWSWIYDQLIPIISHYVSQYKQIPINLIYIAKNENSPYVLYQHIQHFFQISDFNLGNTQEPIYDS